MIVLAHSGHWLVQVLYAVPLIVMAVVLLVGRFRQHRDSKRPPSPPDDAA